MFFKKHKVPLIINPGFIIALYGILGQDGLCYGCVFDTSHGSGIFKRLKGSFLKR
jgi:hypothetical protein